MIKERPATVERPVAGFLFATKRAAGCLRAPGGLRHGGPSALKGLHHAVYAGALLADARVDVEIERGAHAGVAEQRAYRLAVAPALYAARGEGVAQAVELDGGQAEAAHEADVIAAVEARLKGTRRAGEQVAVGGRPR